MTRMMWSGLVLVLVSVPVLAADVIEFRKVDYFEVVTKDNGEQDEKKRDARLEIDREAQTIAIVNEKKGAEKATYAVVPFADVTQRPLRAGEVATAEERHLPLAVGLVLPRQEALAHDRVGRRLCLHAVGQEEPAAAPGGVGRGRVRGRDAD